MQWKIGCAVAGGVMAVSGALATQEVLGCDVLLKDGDSRQETPYSNVAGMRYCEFLLTCKTDDGPKTNVYFTTDLNNADTPMDTCGSFTDIDPTDITTEFGVDGTFMNGPRGWVMNSFSVPTGVVREFHGVKAVWESTLQADPSALRGTPYKYAVVARDSEIHFAVGKPLFILNDPEENSFWVMKSWSEMVDPTLSYDNLADLGDKLKLPEGWTFHVYIPTEEFTITAISGNAHIIQDEFVNTYDGCYIEGGASSCSAQLEALLE